MGGNRIQDVTTLEFSTDWGKTPSSPLYYYDVTQRHVGKYSDDTKAKFLKDGRVIRLLSQANPEVGAGRKLWDAPSTSLWGIQIIGFYRTLPWKYAF